MLRKCLLCLIFVMMLISCAKEKTYEIVQENGVEIVRNTGKPNNSNLTVDLELISTIRGFDELENPDTLSFFNIRSPVFDDSDNIYFFDRYSYKVFKYDKNGKFVLSFGERGQGPGQFFAANSIVSLTDSSIVVSDWGRNHYFDLNGGLIATEAAKSYSISTYRMNIENDEYIDVVNQMEMEGGSYINNELIVKSFADKDKRKVLDAGVKYNSLENRIKYIGTHTMTHDLDNFFLAIRNFDTYLIRVYDFDFNKLQEISMNYTTRSFSSSERERLMDDIKDTDFSKSNWQREYYEDLSNNKLAFTNLHYDKSQDLLIVERQGDIETLSVSFDIFKDGVYLNSFSVPVEWDNLPISGMSKRFYFNNGKMYAYKSDNNSIEIYKMNYNF